jgi:hypothetical protein
MLQRRLQLRRPFPLHLRGDRCREQAGDDPGVGLDGADLIVGPIPGVAE